MTELNLPGRARAASGLSMREFAKLLGTSHSHCSRWEGGGKWSATAAALFAIIEMYPTQAIRALRVLRGLEPGFTGDGGAPPEQRSRGGGPAIDEHGFVGEPELGYEGELAVESVGWDGGGDGDDEDDDLAVPGFSPEFGPD